MQDDFVLFFVFCFLFCAAISIFFAMVGVINIIDFGFTSFSGQNFELQLFFRI